MTRRPQFSCCYDRGRRFFSKSFTLFVYERDDAGDSWRLGLAVSKKIGKAVQRNRIKRLIREFFRLRQHELSLLADIVVVPRRGVHVASFDFSRIASELDPLMAKIMARTSG